ncbi:MAG: response regulator [Balneola sp.]
MNSNKKILIVEDDMIISLVVENMVKELGYSVVGKAVSGEEAIKIAQEEQPDILLMDIRLKGDMDGIDTVAKIKESIDPKVIYLTGNSDRLNFERAKDTDFADLIVKPFTIGDLDKSLKLLVD